MEENVDEDERVNNLLKWGVEIGISDSSTVKESAFCLGDTLFVSNFPEAGGRGLGAFRDIKKGESVLGVPKSALITTEALLQTDRVLSDSVKNHPYLSSVQKLVVCLLYEVGKRKDSLWYPYLENLPRCYSTLSSFGKFEMQAFQVDYAVWAAEKARWKVENEWKEARAIMQELRLKPRLLAFGSWLWASATISSRTLHIPWDEAGCLCPVGDLFNYAAPGESATDSQSSEVLSSCCNDIDSNLAPEQLDANSRLTDGGYEEEVAKYCFYAKKHYRKGEQVLLSYGTYTNLELLEHYGFLLDENPNDKVHIPFGDGMSLSSSWPRDLLYIEQSGKPSFALFAALRLWVLPPNLRKHVGNFAYSGSPLSNENEIRVVQLIARNCENALKSLSTSFEEDRDLLWRLERLDGVTGCTIADFSDRLASLGSEAISFAESHLPQNGGHGSQCISRKVQLALERWKLAIRWRIGYKRTLLDCINFCKTAVFNG